MTIQGTPVELDDDIYRDYALSYGHKAKKILSLRISAISRIKDTERAAKIVEKLLGRIRQGELVRAKRHQFLKTLAEQRKTATSQ